MLRVILQINIYWTDLFLIIDKTIVSKILLKDIVEKTYM